MFALKLVTRYSFIFLMSQVLVVVKSLYPYNHSVLYVSLANKLDTHSSVFYEYCLVEINIW